MKTQNGPIQKENLLLIKVILEIVPSSGINNSIKMQKENAPQNSKEGTQLKIKRYKSRK